MASRATRAVGATILGCPRGAGTIATSQRKGLSNFVAAVDVPLTPTLATRSMATISGAFVVASRTHANCGRQGATRAVAVPPASHAHSRFFSGTASSRRKSSGPREEYHEVSASGSKLWTFKQVQKASKPPKGKTILVDTREPHELAETGRIPHAINIPVSSRPESFHISEDLFKDHYGFRRPAKDAELVFYCKAGVRSRAAAALAKEAGWENVGEYPGSWLDWEKKGGEKQKVE